MAIELDPSVQRNSSTTQNKTSNIVLSIDTALLLYAGSILPGAHEPPKAAKERKPGDKASIQVCPIQKLEVFKEYLPPAEYSREMHMLLPVLKSRARATRTSELEGACSQYMPSNTGLPGYVG